MGVKRGLFNLVGEIKIASVRKLITQCNTLNDLPKDNKKREKNLKHTLRIFMVYGHLLHIVGMNIYSRIISRKSRLFYMKNISFGLTNLMVLLHQ
jgi:hypothetical protein